jgi:hypothetical protein
MLRWYKHLQAFTAPRIPIDTAFICGLTRSVENYKFSCVETASVVRFPGYRFRGPGSIPLPDFLLSSGSEMGPTQPRQ